MKLKSVVFSMLVSLLAFFPLSSNAVLVESGDVLRVDFDLSGETPSSPYDGIYTILGFGESDYLDPGESFTIALFDDDGAGLADGTGYFLVYDILGSFDVTLAQAAGRHYPGGPVISTDYVDGVVSFMDVMPGIESALSIPYSFTNIDETYVSWVGMDRHLIEQVGVPEPATILLLSLGLIMGGLLSKRRRVS